MSESQLTITTKDAFQEVEGWRNGVTGPVNVLRHQTSLVDLYRLQNITANHAKTRTMVQALEVGSWVGESALAIHAKLPPGSKLWCVDNFSGGPEDDPLHGVVEAIGPARVEAVFRTNCGRHLGTSINLLKMSSLEASQLHWRHPFDLIFLDGGHTQEAVEQDLAIWWPLLREGGVLCGHDYGEQSYFPGVTEAVNQFVTEHQLSLYAPPDGSIWSTTKVSYGE